MKSISVRIFVRTELHAKRARYNDRCCKCEKEFGFTFCIYETSIWEFHFHLDCFTPILEQFISPKDVHYYFEIGESQENFEKVKVWVKQWNSRFIPVEYSSTTPSHFRKRLKDFTCKNRRTWIEIFKFLSPFDWAIIALTCKEFYQVSWDQELWQFTYALNTNSSGKVTDFRVDYISQHACYECGDYAENDEFWCPILQKIICIRCRYKKKKFALYNKNQIREIFGINPNTTQLVYGKSETGKYAYLFMIEKELKRIRIKNKETILKKFKKNNDAKDIKEILEHISDEDGKSPNNVEELLEKNKFRVHFDEIKNFVNSNRRKAELMKKLGNDNKQ